MALLLDLLVSGQTRLNDDTYAKNIYADKFIRTGSSDLYVLLGGGGHKLLSDFSMVHEHPYLPLAGGTMTGALTVKQYIFGYNYNHAGGNAPAFLFDKPGSYYTGIGANGETDTIYFSAATISNGEASWVTSYKQKWKFNGTIYQENNAVIHAGNIGSQSVSYATSSGNADTVDSQHFSYSNDSNSPTYLWATNSNGSSFLAARGSISVNYANSAGSVEWTGVKNKPSTFAPSAHDHTYLKKNFKLTGITNIPFTGEQFEYGILTGAATGVASPEDLKAFDSYSQVEYINLPWYSNLYGGQLMFGANSGKIGYRTIHNGTWTLIKEIIHSDNYTTYTVKKDGTGATGTWGINISGNAGSVAWANITGKPSSFTPSSHTHDDRYYTESESDSRYVNVTGDTMTGDLHVYAHTYCGYGTGSSVIDYNVYAMYVGTNGTRTGTAGSYIGGIAFTHMIKYSGGYRYCNSPQGWIGLRTVDYPGSERSSLVFATKPGTGTSNTGDDIPIERMCITPAGNVGVGTINPSTYKLEVNGDTYSTGYVRATSGFVKGSSSNDYVLLGGGGHKAISDFSMAHSHPYLPLAGGTMNQESHVVFPGTSTDTNYGGSIEFREVNYVTTSQTDWSYAPGITFHWGGRSVGKLGLTSDGNLAWRNQSIIHSGNIGSQSVSYASSAGISSNSDKLDNIDSTGFLAWTGMSASGGSSAPFQTSVDFFNNTANLNAGARMIYNCPGSEYTILYTRRSDDVGHGSILRWGYPDNYIRMIRMISGSPQTSDWEKISAGYADSAGYASSAGNADTVDGYHASSLWRSDGGTWNPSANIALNASGNGQEWSFDITRNGYTGCYWHVWDSSRDTMLSVTPDDGKVRAPYGFVGNLEGAAGRLSLTNCYNGTVNNDLWSTIKSSNSSYLGTATIYEVYNDGGPDTYGEVLDIVSLHHNHWQPQLWFGAGTSGRLRYRNKDYNNDSWGNWYTVAFTSDIPTSLPANGGNADTVDGEHSSAFAHIGAHNNLTASGNEFTFASSGFSGIIWFNYRTAGGTNGNITEYWFGNGAGGRLGIAIHSGNYNSYAPTLTGTGASGTWGISITGNAATATSAGTAGNADTVDNYHASNLTKFYLSPMSAGASADSAKSWFINTMPSASGAIVYNVPGSEKTIIAGKSSGPYGHMLQLNYDDNYLRILRYQGGSWKTTDWEKISAGYADSAGSVAWGNITGKPSTFEPSSHSHNYLPLSGGTCTGNIYAPAFYESSDERLKDFYNSIDVDLDKLSSLPKKFFKWKSNPNGEFEIGTSAQELQKIYPQLVNTDDKGYLTVAYDKLSIIALRAIDKLYEMNKNLERRIQILESKL